MFGLSTTILRSKFIFKALFTADTVLPFSGSRTPTNVILGGLTYKTIVANTPT